MVTARFVWGGSSSYLGLLTVGLFGRVVEEDGIDRVNVLGGQWGGAQLLVTLFEEAGGGNEVHRLPDGLGIEVTVGVAELEQVLLTLAGLECEVE